MGVDIYAPILARCTVSRALNADGTMRYLLSANPGEFETPYTCSIFLDVAPGSNFSPKEGDLVELQPTIRGKA